MARRILNKSSAGTGATFGSDDTDYINKLLTGEDQSAEDPVDISTTFKIRNAKLHISNAGNDNVSIIQSAASGSNKTITLPDLTGTAAVTTGAQTFEDKTIAFGDNTLTDVASTNTAQTLENKTMNALDNTFEEVFVSPEKKLVGYMAPTQVGNPGVGTLLRPGTTTANGGSITTSGITGKFIRWTTGATADNQAGCRLSSANSFIVRGKNGRFKCRFRLNTQTDVRMFAGLFTSSSAFPTGDDPLNAAPGVGVGVISTDTNFQIIHNDNAGATNFTSTGVAKNSDIHTIEIKADSGDTGWIWSLDGGAFSSPITTEVPGTGGTVGPHVMVQTATSSAANMDMWYALIEMDPF